MNHIGEFGHGVDADVDAMAVVGIVRLRMEGSSKKIGSLRGNHV
jgi:hypothetical protein